MKQINVFKILMYVFITLFMIASLGGIIIYLFETKQLVTISKVIITSIGSSILSIGGFFISFSNYNNSRRDKLEKEQKERFEKYDTETKKYKNEKENIKKEVEKKFSDLIILVNKERKETYRTAFKTNEIYKKMIELSKKENVNEDFKKMVEDMSSCFSNFEEEIDLNDLIIDKMLEILSGKEDTIRLGKPKLKE